MSNKQKEITPAIIAVDGGFDAETLAKVLQSFQPEMAVCLTIGGKTFRCSYASLVFDETLGVYVSLA